MVIRNVHKECLEALIADLQHEQKYTNERAFEDPTVGNIAQSETMDIVMFLIDARLYEMDQQLDKVYR